MTEDLRTAVKEAADKAVGAIISVGGSNHMVRDELGKAKAGERRESTIKLC